MSVSATSIDENVFYFKKKWRKGSIRIRLTFGKSIADARTNRKQML